MKKLLTAAVAMGIAVSLTACGESLQKPTEPTQTLPVWAMEQEQTAPTAQTEATTVPTEPETTEPPETTEITVPTEETQVPTVPAYPMEEKFSSAGGTVYVKKGVNLRDQGNVDSQVLAVLPKGEALQRVGVSQDGWTAVYYRERVSYVSTDYLEEREAEKPTEPSETQAESTGSLVMEEKFQKAEGTVYAKKGVNVRDQANTNSNILNRLEEGEAVERIGTSQDGWTAIHYDDRVCYVSSEYLVDKKPEVAPDPNEVREQELDDQVYTNHAVNMREGPGMDRSILVKVPEYTELHRIGDTGTGWFKVEYKDKVGYISEAYIVPKYVDSEEHPQETVVDETIRTIREVNLRKGPGTDRQILARVPEGTQLTRIATTSNEWSKVVFEDQEGYISSKYVEKVITSQSEG